jgi:hypothetical protein
MSEESAPVEEKKAYDLGVLGSKLKDAGLELAEEAAGKVVAAVIDWVSESAKLSATPYDDMALVILPKLKDFIMSEIAKIDGKEGA